MKDIKIAVLGGGSWATAIAKMLCNNVNSINWWMRDAEQVEHIKKYNHNPRYLQSVEFHAEQINVSSNLKAIIDASDIGQAELFYTGTSSTFVSSNQFGSAVATPSGNFSFTGNQVLVNGGNRFWLTYDIPLVANEANNNHMINATLVSIVANSITTTANLVGAASGRTIINKTSISELGNGEKLILAPNPSSSVFTISYANLSNEKTFAYRVIDITGKEVLSGNTNAVSGLNIYPIDVTSIAKGLYFVECVVGNEKVTNKIVVE